MATIDLNLFATLSKYLPEKSDSFEVKEGTCVKELISTLSIPDNMVKLIFINGKKEEEGYELKNNDRVGLFPPVGGG